MARRGYQTIKLTFKGTPISVYAAPRIADALAEIEKDMSIYHGVKLHLILEVVYKQGKKDGAREVFETLDKSVASVKRAIPHRRPGRPRRRIS